MKKILFPSILFVLLVISILFNVLMADLLDRFQEPKPQEYIYTEFTLSDYAWGIEAFPKDENVGPIVDKDNAAQKGIALWRKYINKPAGYDPVNGEPIVVGYDTESDCWLIMGTLPSETLGAVPTAIVRADGEVVAVWMN